MSKTSKIRRRAQEFLKKGKPEKAVVEYKRLLERDSKNPNIFNELGDVYLRLNDRIKAVSCFEKAVNNYERVALYNNAAAVCKKILRVVPDRRDTLFQLGELRAKQHFGSDAAKYFSQYLDYILTEPSSEEDVSEKLEIMLEFMPQNRDIIVKISDAFYQMDLKIKAGQALNEYIKTMKRSGNLDGLGMIQQKLSSIRSELSEDEAGKLAEGENDEPEEEDDARKAVEEVIEQSREDESQAPPDFGFMDNSKLSGEQPDEVVSRESGPEREPAGTDTGESDKSSAGPAQHYEEDREGLIDSGREEVSAGDKSGVEGNQEEAQASYEGGAGVSEAGEEEEPAEYVIPENKGDTETGREDMNPKSGVDIFSSGEEKAEATQQGEPSGSEGDNLAEDITSDVEEDDFRSHYDLGMAYLEMALFKESIKEFQIASRSDRLKLKSLEMIGYCFLQQNMPGLAVKQLRRGLDMADSIEGDTLGLHYNLGLAYEMMGEMEKAREQFEDVYIVDVTFKDIEEKMKKFTTST